MTPELKVDIERLKDFAAVARADGRKDMSRQLKEIASRLEDGLADRYSEGSKPKNHRYTN